MPNIVKHCKILLLRWRHSSIWLIQVSEWHREIRKRGP
jgi:hypothetical protein